MAGTAHARAVYLAGAGALDGVPVETAASVARGDAGRRALLLCRAAAAGAGRHGDDETALAAGVLAIACPLFWSPSAGRSSDAPGLAAALGVQALLATAFARQRGWRDAR